MSVRAASPSPLPSCLSRSRQRPSRASPHFKELPSLLDLFLVELLPLRRQLGCVDCVTTQCGMCSGRQTKLTRRPSPFRQRWAFYINLPIGGVALVIAILFLNIPARRQELSILARLGSLDWAGSSLLIGSIVCLLIVLQVSQLGPPCTLSFVADGTSTICSLRRRAVF